MTPPTPKPSAREPRDDSARVKRAIEPPPTRVRFPDPRAIGDRDVVAVGEDYSASTILAAYRAGIFPWPHGDIVAWFSPDPRAIFPLASPPHWSRSLRRTLRKHAFEVTVDEAFPEVMRACGAARPDGTWINSGMLAGYTELHRLGWAHSVEVWADEPHGRALVGGIYGVAIGGAFAGESMFHARTDASKIAFASLVERLRASGFSLFDVQVMNPHLESLGCIEIPRDEFLRRLSAAQRTDASLAVPTGR